MLLLASASPARRRLLEQAGIPHRVQVSGVDEEAIRDPDPLRLVQRLAQAKAEAVAWALPEFQGGAATSAGLHHSESSTATPTQAETHGQPATPAQPTAQNDDKQPNLVRDQARRPALNADAMLSCDSVLGCDSLLVFAGEVFGKPASPAEAVARWQRMSGGRAELHTGHCLLRPGQPALLETVTTGVVFAAVDLPTIEAYVATGEPLACAGGFALEGRGSLLVERIEGCCSNVIGLSLPLLRRWLGGFPGS